MPLRKKKVSPLTARWRKLPAYVRNKYFLTLVAFTVLMVFIDRHNIYVQFRLASTVDRLEEDLGRYDERIEAAETERQDMQDNRERFARENYFMQKDDELRDI